MAPRDFIRPLVMFGNQLGVSGRATVASPTAQRQNVIRREFVRGWQPIFSGVKESAQALASKLEAKGLHSFIEDRQGPIMSTSGARASYSVVRVAPI